MKKTLSSLILLTFAFSWAWAEDTTLQVAPSDQIVYPDASQILNKTDPKPTPPATTNPATPLPPSQPIAQAAPLTSIPSPRPVVAAVPVPASTPAVPVVVPVAVAPKVDPNHGWFLKWTIAGAEESAHAWAQALGFPTTVVAAGGQWDVWAGPFDVPALASAMKGQAGVTTLVRR